MTLWFATLLGLVQGLTEFIPVSSTAHLRIVPTLVGRPDAGAAYTAVIQLGTLAAVLVYFARALLVDRRSEEARLALYIVLGTIPIGIAGIALKPYVKGPLRSLWVVAIALIGVALVLWVVDRTARQSRALGGLRASDALLIGV